MLFTILAKRFLANPLAWVTWALWWLLIAVAKTASGNLGLALIALVMFFAHVFMVGVTWQAADFEFKHPKEGAL